MPKEEKKRAPVKGKATATPLTNSESGLKKNFGQKIGGMGDMMAELKAKQMK